MATQQDVKKYLAYWFQLGKKVKLQNNQQEYQPSPVMVGNSYSPDFEACWQNIIESNSDQAYLEGTEETIQELLSPAWEVSPCSRCAMPVPVKNTGLPSLICPCHDIPSWPNTNLPQPRSPIDSQQRLNNISERLNSSR